MAKSTLFLILLMSYGVTFAQKVRKPISPILGWSHALQQRDYLMGFDIGIPNNDRNIHYLLSFDFRPHGRKVQEFAGGNLFYQYQEKRYVVTLGGRYLHELKESGKGVFVGLSGGYNFGEYRGLKLKPDQGWIIRPNGGFFWNIAPDLFSLELGYEYFDSRSDAVTDHWVFVTFLFTLNRNDY